MSGPAATCNCPLDTGGRKLHAIGCPWLAGPPAPAFGADQVRVIVQEELAAVLQRLAGALGAAAQPALPAMPASFEEALALVNGATSLAQLAELADAEAAGADRDGIEQAIQFRRQELLEAAGGDHRDPG